MFSACERRYLVNCMASLIDLAEVPLFLEEIRNPSTYPPPPISLSLASVSITIVMYRDGYAAL